MKITAWRIVKAGHITTAFTGEGARRFGGRWNNKGTRVVYTAGSQALAVLEMLVHLQNSDLLRHYCLIPVTFDALLVEDLDSKSLPPRWNKYPAPAVVRSIGDRWVARRSSAVLRVPSVIVHDENNFLINVQHPDFGKVKIGPPRPYRFDPRLG